MLLKFSYRKDIFSPKEVNDFQHPHTELLIINAAPPTLTNIHSFSILITSEGRLPETNLIKDRVHIARISIDTQVFYFTEELNIKGYCDPGVVATVNVFGVISATTCEYPMECWVKLYKPQIQV